MKCKKCNGSIDFITIMVDGKPDKPARFNFGLNYCGKCGGNSIV